MRVQREDRQQLECKMSGVHPNAGRSTGTLTYRKGAHGSGTFALPGGNLEYLEQLESCAVRETKEETGLAVVNPRIEWLENCIFGEGDDRVHYLTVFVRADLADEVCSFR